MTSGPDSLAIEREAAQSVPVPLARLENANRRQGEPRRDRRLGLRNGKRALEHARVRTDPQKGP